MVGLTEGSKHQKEQSTRVESIMQQILIKLDTQGNALTNASSTNLGFTNNGTVNAAVG